MSTLNPEEIPPGSPSLEERRLELDERRLALDGSFARKWWPTLATLAAALIAALFAWVQTREVEQETDRARHDIELREQHDWQTRIVSLYFNRRELFDITKDPEAAESNLRVLIAVAPQAVRSILGADLSAALQRIPPTSSPDLHRLRVLAAAAALQQTLGSMSSAAAPGQGLKPDDFTVYVQYLKGSDSDKQIGSIAWRKLAELGYHVPNLQAVMNVPHNLQVRYYHSDQKSLALGLAQQLQKALGTRTQATAVPFKSPRPLPGGILEVWIPDTPNGD